MTTVTTAGPGKERARPGSGCAMPGSSSRRASARAAGLSGTGVPENQAATCRAPAAVSCSTRTCEPRASTVPPATSRVPGSARSRNPAGASPPPGGAAGAFPVSDPRGSPRDARDPPAGAVREKRGRDGGTARCPALFRGGGAARRNTASPRAAAGAKRRCRLAGQATPLGGETRERVLVAVPPWRPPPDRHRHRAVRVVRGRLRGGTGRHGGQRRLPVPLHALGVRAVERQAGEELRRHAPAPAGVVMPARAARSPGVRGAERSEQVRGPPHRLEPARIAAVAGEEVLVDRER